MADWAFAIELDSQRHWAQARTNGILPSHNDAMRRLTVTLNTASPPSRQLLTVVRCCQCGHRSGLPTDYSTPYQCLGYSGLYTRFAVVPSSAAQSPATSPASTSPQSATTSNEEQRVACRHVYCLECKWLVNGDFRTLHPIEIRDETDYSGYGYGSQNGQQGGQQNPTNGTQRGRIG